MFQKLIKIKIIQGLIDKIFHTCATEKVKIIPFLSPENSLQIYMFTDH